MKPLRILHIVDSLNAGGMEAQLVSLLNRLPSEEFHFHVHCLSEAGVHAKRLRPDISLSVGNKPRGISATALWQVHQLLLQHWDLIHTHNWGPLVYAHAATLGGRRAAILHGEHAQCSHSELKPHRRWLRRCFYRSCRAVHTVSQQQLRDLQAQGFDHQRLMVLQNGVDTTRFLPGERPTARARIGLAQHETVIGVVARFGEFKRHLEVISAFETLEPRQRSLRLLLVGDGGPMRERVHAAVAASPHADLITLAGLQSDMPTFYQAMDVLLVASANEGLSNATLEAMACGCPVLSNRVCGAQEALGAPEEGGWIEDLSQVTLLRAAIGRVLDLPPTHRSKIGEGARQRVLSHFSWSAMAQRYQQCYHTLHGL